MDVNDSPPVFTTNTFLFYLPEGTKVGSEITTLEATSKDVGKNAEIRYRLRNADSYFSVAPESGVLSLKAPLDFERQQIYYLTIVANDLGEPPLSATAVVTVQVTDENDNVPQFPIEGFQVSVPENSPPSTRLKVEVRARDLDSGDNGKITYSVVGGDPDHMFAIDKDTGSLFVRQSPDREVKDVYTLAVMATDHGIPPLSSQTRVIINIEDENDNAPQFSQASYTVVIQIDDMGNMTQEPYMENGDLVNPNNRIEVTDADTPLNGGPFSWTMMSDGMRYSVMNGKISPNHKTGLRVGVEHLKVQVCDAGQKRALCNSTVVTVKIVKAESVPPKILPLNITANLYYKLFQSLELGQLKLRSHKVSDVTFSLLSYGDLFSVDKYGKIFTKENLQHGTYRVQVQAEYKGLKSQETLTAKIVLITDEMIAKSNILSIQGAAPQVFFFHKSDDVISQFIAKSLKVSQDHVFIISVQQNSAARRKRAAENDLLVLFAVYNPEARSYFSPLEIQALDLGPLSKLLQKPASLITSCPTSPCQNSGRCHLVAEIRSSDESSMELAGMARTSPTFKMTPYCTCVGSYHGQFCELSTAVCNCASYQTCHFIGASRFLCLNRDQCLTEECKAVNDSALHFTGAGGMSWSLSSHAAFPDNLLQLNFQLRTVQTQPTFLFVMQWTKGSGRDVVLQLGASGRLEVVPAVKGKPQTAWTRSQQVVNDGKWHHVNMRFLRVTPEEISKLLDSSLLRNWTIELVVDKIEPSYKIIPWADAPQNRSLSTGKPYIGCLKDISINGIPAPTHRAADFNSINSSKNASIKEVLQLVKVEGVTKGCSAEYFGTPCASAPCLHAGYCSNQGLTYSCNCQGPYIGKRCEINTEPCAENPCQNGGTCRQNGRHFTCDCPAGLSGKRCEFGLYCGPDVNPCKHSARCEESSSGALCHCAGTGFQGKHCGDDVDECILNQQLCSSRGTCMNLPGSYYCNCSLGYSGRSCENFHVPRIEPGNAGILGLSFREFIAILGMVSSLLILALVIFLILSCVFRRRKANRQNKRFSGEKSYPHEPSEAMALVTLASGEQRMIPQKQLDLRYSLPNCYSSEQDLAGATYAGYEKPHPPHRPFSFISSYSDTAGSPRCLTPTSTATISRRSNGGLQPAFIHPNHRPAQRYRQGPGSHLGDITDEQELRNVSPMGSQQFRPDYIWDTSDWNTASTGMPPDLLSDSPYCPHHAHLQLSECGSGASSPAHYHQQRLQPVRGSIESLNSNGPSRRANIQRMLHSNYLPQHLNVSNMDFEEEEEDNSRASLLHNSGYHYNEESHRLPIITNGEMHTSTSTFKGSSSIATDSTKGGSSGSTEINSGSITPTLADTPSPPNKESPPTAQTDVNINNNNNKPVAPKAEDETLA